jgi:hypothetical protein
MSLERSTHWRVSGRQGESGDGDPSTSVESRDGDFVHRRLATDSPSAEHRPRSRGLLARSWVYNRDMRLDGERGRQRADSLAQGTPALLHVVDFDVQAALGTTEAADTSQAETKWRGPSRRSGDPLAHHLDGRNLVRVGHRHVRSDLRGHDRVPPRTQLVDASCEMRVEKDGRMDVDETSAQARANLAVTRVCQCPGMSPEESCPPGGLMYGPISVPHDRGA